MHAGQIGKRAESAELANKGRCECAIGGDSGASVEMFATWSFPSIPGSEAGIRTG